MRRARVDAAQAQIVRALRAAGLTVLHLHEVGHGCPDLCVSGFDYRINCGTNLLVELKSPGRKLTPDEIRFASSWHGPLIVATTAADILRYFGIEKP